MHSHYCVNHFPKHVAVYFGACSFPSLRSHFTQHHSPNLLSVIATKLCWGNLLPSEALPAWTWSQQLASASQAAVKGDSYCLLNTKAVLSAVIAKR